MQSLGDAQSQQQDLPADFRHRAALLVVEDAGRRTVRAEPGADGVSYTVRVDGR